MFNITRTFNVRVPDGVRTVKALDLGDQAEAVIEACRTAMVGRNYTGRAYMAWRDGTKVRLLCIQGSDIKEFLQEPAAMSSFLPNSGELLAIAPPAKSAPKSTPTPWTVTVSVQGASWQMVARSGDRSKTTDGAVEGHKPGQATVLAATVAALSALHAGEWAVSLSVSDKNVRKMLNGEMSSKKNAALLTEARQLVATHDVTLS
jgi:hypothetical protein